MRKGKGSKSEGKMMFGDFLKWMREHKIAPKRRHDRKHGWTKMSKGVGKI